MNGPALSTATDSRQITVCSQATNVIFDKQNEQGLRRQVRKAEVRKHTREAAAERRDTYQETLAADPIAGYGHTWFDCPMCGTKSKHGYPDAEYCPHCDVWLEPPCHCPDCLQHPRGYRPSIDGASLETASSAI